MQLLPGWAPNIHPIIIHLPIAAFLLAVFFDFLSLIFKKQNWLSKAAILLYIIGAIGAMLAVFTGEDAVAHLTIPKSMLHDVNEHANWGKATAWFFGLYAAFRLILVWFNSKSRSARFGMFILSFVGVFLLVETGDHGAKLVYKYGIGTTELKKEMIALKKKKENIKASIPTLRNGGWVWTPGPGSPSMLISDFSWYKGGPEDLNASTIVEDNGDTVLSVNPNNKMVIIGFGKPMNNLHAELLFKPENFKGELSLTENIQDSSNYNFLTYKNDSLLIGNILNGNQSVSNQRTITVPEGNWINMSVIINNSKVEGFINGKQIITGEQQIQKEGVFGIGIKGNGLVLIKRIEVTNDKMKMD